MNYIKYSDLNEQEMSLVDKAFEAAGHSESPSGHKVGSAIICKDGRVFQGATNTRTRTIGSTCAERMAVDQMFYHGNKYPELVALVGLLQRDKWTVDNICTPCGVCLDMYWEMIMKLGMEDIDILCVSWNKKRILKTSLTELYPRIEAVRR
ncbi:MAG: hypothetical protein WDZ85_00300 [Candidatus Paceibacterota bacterium]